ncbi:Hypothetical predicted protein, partial [Olea europaea subsp. europaea]
MLMQDFDLCLAAFSQTHEPAHGSDPVQTPSQTLVLPLVSTPVIQSSSSIICGACESTPQPAMESTNYFKNTSGSRKDLRKRKHQ